MDHVRCLQVSLVIEALHWLQANNRLATLASQHIYLHFPLLRCWESAALGLVGRWQAAGLLEAGAGGRPAPVIDFNQFPLVIQVG